MLSTNLVLTILVGALLYVSIAPSHAYSRPGMTTGRCSLSFYSSMRAYDCIGLNLSDIPNDLSSSTEILDVSMNRIRELTNSSFKNYRYLKKVYLNDNMILTIEAGAFDGLDDLETLDLTMNALVEVPVSLFHMSSLEKLMIGRNKLLDIMDLINRAKPITAPIKYLDISYSPLLTQLPEFGVMMDIVHLNVTANHFVDVSLANFLGLCNLRWFTNDNLTMDFAAACDCGRISKWFEQMKIKSNPPFYPRCEFAENKCLEDFELNAAEQSVHEKCIVDYQARENIRNVTRICYIVFGVIGGIILVVAVCYIYYRFQRFSDEDLTTVKKEATSQNCSAHPLIANNNKEYMDS